MRKIQIITYLGLSWFTSHLAEAAGREGDYRVPADAEVSVIDDNAYWHYLGNSYDSERTNQYGVMVAENTSSTGVYFPARFSKRFYKTPAIHRYHGAGSVLQPIYFILPPAAYSNLPREIKAVVPSADNIDIFFLVTLVQDWHETDGATRPLAVRPHHWNDPEAPYSSGGYSKSFADEVGIFDPSPPELKVNGTVNTLYAITETTHQGDGMVISSGDSDHLVGGYTYTPGEQPHLDLCFWGVVKGPTPSGPRVAVTLHWVTSDHSLYAIKSLRNGMRIAEWAMHSEALGIYAPCAERLCSLLGLPGKSTRRLSTGEAGAGGRTFGKPMGGGGLYGAHAEDDELARALSASLADQGRLRRSSSPRGTYATTLRGDGHGGAGASALSWGRAPSPRRSAAAEAKRDGEALRAVEVRRIAEREAAERAAAEFRAAERAAAEDVARRAEELEAARIAAEVRAAERAAAEAEHLRTADEARRLGEIEVAEIEAAKALAEGRYRIDHLPAAYKPLANALWPKFRGKGMSEHQYANAIRGYLEANPGATPESLEKQMRFW